MHDSIIVLHVDDEPAFLDQTEIFLEKEEEELDVTTVQSPTKGLELLDDRDFDVIVSDYQMPDMDGLELLRVVREERESKIPFIILTGKGREEVAMKALNLGADRYLQKGGDPKTLFCVLAQAIKQEYESFEKEKEPKISVREKSKIFDSTVEHVLYQNLDHDILWANKAAGDSIGEDPEDLIGRKCYEIWHDREEECKNCPVQDAIESGEIERGEVRSPDGRYWIITGNPITDEEGDLQGVVEVTLEITAMKEKEKRLEASEERYRRLFETAQDGMLILNAESGKIKDANPYIQELIGYSKEELVGRELWEIGTFKSVVENRERFQELVEEGYIRYEDLPLETKGGEEAPVEFVSNTYEAGGEEVVQCNIRDVS
ncbi:MAG: PAS domain S-box protein, partial [Thermoplasmata archaeon]